jgi:hypothetical protein
MKKLSDPNPRWKKGGLWIRINLIPVRIWIQHFCSIRIRIQNQIRIQAKTELSKTISFSNFFEIKIWVKLNQKYWCYLNFFQKVVSAFFHWNFLVFLPLDPDSDSQYGSRSTKSLNPDPIRIHNPEKKLRSGSGIKWSRIRNSTDTGTH